MLRRTTEQSQLDRAQSHADMRLCTTACKTCCPTSDASPCQNVRHSDHRLEFYRSCSSPPPITGRYMALEHPVSLLAVTDVVVVIAVGEMRGQLAEIVLPN